MTLALQDIPLSIKDHFGSERVSNLVKEISMRSQIVTLGLLPGALYSLITKDVTAHDFVDALSEDAGLSKTRALAVAKEIKERVLEPVRRDLFRWGIDISAINVLNAPTLESIAIEEPEEKSGEASISLLNLEEKPSEAVRIAPRFEESSLAPKPATDGPLILHTENTPQAEGGSLASKQEKKPFKGFSFGFGLFGKKEEPTKESPIVARLEIPERRWREPGQVFGEKKKPMERSVNYSEFRTPITQLGEPENVLKKEMKISAASDSSQLGKAGAIPTPKEEVKPKATLEALAQKPIEKILPVASQAQNGEPSKKFFWFKKNEASLPILSKSDSPNKNVVISKEAPKVTPAPKQEKQNPTIASIIPQSEKKSTLSSVPTQTKPTATPGPTIEGNKIDLRPTTNN